jgi:hypothetical protein
MFIRHVYNPLEKKLYNNYLIMGGGLDMENQKSGVIYIIYLNEDMQDQDMETGDLMKDMMNTTKDYFFDNQSVEMEPN